MDDKEKRKVGSALFEKFANKGGPAAKKVKDASEPAIRKTKNWSKEAIEGIEAGLSGGHIDFEKALKEGQTNIDPQTYMRARDGKKEASEKPKPKRFIRNLDERIEQAKQEVNEDYFNAKITELEKLIRDTMDERGTNTIAADSATYEFVGLVRIGERGEFSIGKNGQPMFRAYKDEPEKEPGTAAKEETATFLPTETAAGKGIEIPEPAETVVEEEAEATEPTETVEEEEAAKHLPARTDAGEKAAEPEQAAEPVEITINGKPVFVKPALTGDDVSFNGKYPEISQDLAREGVAKMAEDGTTKWAKEVGEGNNRHTVEVAMKASAGRTQVVVDKSLKGNETARTGGHRVSGGFWDMAEGSMYTNGNYNYATTMPDGKVVTCVLNIKMNGKPARINGWGDRYSAGEDAIPIEKYWHALDYMKEHGTQNWAETLQDGTIIQIGISAQIDGDKRTALDWGSSKIEATVEPEKILVSKDAWMEAGENMLAGEGGRRSYEKTLADGTTVEFRMGARIDGRGAVIEESFDGREVREERDRVLVGRDIFKDATGEMCEKQSISAKAVDRGGNEVEFKRPGKIKMFVDDREISDDEYEDALAEVAGMNDGKTFTKFAKRSSDALEQAKIQTTRSVVNAGITTPMRTIKEGQQKNANILAKIISAISNVGVRASQSIRV